MNVLAIGAHPDDIELGCGGTIAKHVAAGDTVTAIVLTRGGTSRIDMPEGYQQYLTDSLVRSAKRLGFTAMVAGFPDQRLDTVPYLDLTQAIEQIAVRCQPEIVYTHSVTDLNQDHVIVARATMTAFRPKPGCTVKRLLSYEVPSSTEWSESAFWPTVYSVLNLDQMRAKREALENYGEELPPWPHPRSLGGISALMELRGAAVGADAAEAFVLLREIV